MHFNSWLTGVLRHLAAQSVSCRSRTVRPYSKNRSEIIERLESRQLLTATVGFETQVNSSIANTQRAPVIATDSAGDYVIAWQSALQDGNGFGIYAQRYSSAGIAQGGEFRVNSYTTGNQINPSIAMAPAGSFVVTWSSSVQDAGTYGVYAQRYNPSGVAQGAEFRVNSYTTSDQFNSNVAIDTAGDFTIAWQSDLQDGSNFGVFAQRYDHLGNAVGSEFRVNTYTTNGQFRPSIAMDGSGNFVIAWTSQGEDNGSLGVFAQRYSAAGAPQGTEFQVNTYTTSDQDFSAVAMNAAGSFVISWDSAIQDGSGHGIYAQRYNAAGALQGVEFRVNTTTTNSQILPAVAMDSTGNFLVTWSSDIQDGSFYGVFGQRFNSAGALDGTEFRINTYTSFSQEDSCTAFDSKGDFVVAWDSQQDGSNTGIYFQRYKPTPAGPIVTGVFDGPLLITPNARLSTPVTTLVVDFSEPMETTGGSTGAHSVLDPNNWRLLRNGTIQHNVINVSSFVFNPVTNRFEATLNLLAPLDDGVYQLVAYPSIRSAVGQNLDGDDNGVAAGNFTRSFIVGQSVASGPETQVNTYTTNGQGNPAVASDAAGNYVVVWESYLEDGSSLGIYGQRYNASGARVGQEFRVNTTTTGLQANATIAMDPQGDFVVAWFFSSSGVIDIHAQRFDANGIAQGSEFTVNSYTTSSQNEPSVAMDSSGDFVIAWQSLNQAGPSSDYDIYAQRFNASGVPQGTQFQVNTFTTNLQRSPSVGMDQHGDFVITWGSIGGSGATSDYEIYAQRYNFDGAAEGSEFHVNTYTTGRQNAPSLAMDANGDFVVAWQSFDETSGHTFEIFARRFSPSGIALTPEFPVNVYTTGDQVNCCVAMDAAGEFAVTWESNGQDGDGYGIYTRRFDPSGTPSSIAELQVNTTTTGAQVLPAIAMDSAGDAVVAWQSNNQDGSNYGIYSQRFKADVSPLIDDVESTPLAAAAPLTTPISLTLQTSDPDDTTWTSATVQITSNYLQGQDVLGFANQLGITGAFNAATGTLTLTGVASVSNYRAALRSVTYHNASGSPNKSLTRTVSFVANDGLQNSEAATRDLIVTPATAPILSGVTGTVTFVENGALMVIASGLVIDDTTTNLLASATVSFTNWQAEDRVQFNNIFALQHSFSQDLTAHTASLTITGIDTLDHYQTLLRSVQYSDVSNNPVITTRVAHFAVSDGTLISNSVVRNISVAAVDDAPVLSAIESTPLVYQANNSAFPSQLISATLLTSDPDSTNLTKAVIQITSGYQNAANDHDLLSFTNQLGITGAFNAATGALTLTGNSAVGNYRTAIRSVLFSATGTALVAGTRTLTITITDDATPTAATSAAITRNVTVVTTNVPPALSGIPATALAYVRGSTALAIAPGLFVLDTDGINLAGATIQVAANYQNGQDVLAFTPGFGITGSFSAATGKLTLTGVASLANYQTLLRSVTFKTNTSAASMATRSISWIVNDGLADSSAVTRNVTMT